MTADSHMTFGHESIQPMPVRIKRVHCESTDSYIRRVAHANGTTASTVGIWLHEAGIVPRTISRATWYRTWSYLADDIQSGRFAAPTGALDRTLCRRCSRGASASGQMPRFGLICLRHRCWIDPCDGSLATREELRSEREFRTKLAPIGVHIESAHMQFALRLVALAVSPRWVADSAQRGSGRTLQSQLFVPQVAVAVDLFAHNELVAMAQAELGLSLAVGEEWVKERIQRFRVGEEPWRAAALLQTTVQEIVDYGPRLNLSQLLYRLSR